ncbi:MAG TPA: ABC transporter ATP-binding protein [bacterium]|nr:ABC transporter ATP-binding protein [bacterium]
MKKLVLRNLVKAFGQTRAVDQLNLELEAGEFVSLLGPSGCGKTTTLRMIAGFLPPSAGSIEMNGQVLSSPQGCVRPEKRGMSMIFQSYAVWPNMTVEQNVAFGLTLRRLPAAEIARRVSEMLEVVHLEPLKARYPAELSGGQQQRVALARAMVVQPEVLLLDEPLSNLDASLREEMRFEIRRLHETFRITTVYVTHDQAEAMVTSDRIAVMNQGRLEQLDEPFALYNRPRTRFVAGFIGRTNLVPAQARDQCWVCDGFAVPLQALPALDGAGAALFSVRPQSLHLRAQAPPQAEGRVWVEARVCERAYLGELWDYQVLPRGGQQPLRVTTAPQETYALEQQVWLGIDPGQMTPILEKG